MRGQFTSVQIRRSFRVHDPSSVRKLFLYIRYDDGFIAYINGKQVASGSVLRQSGRLRVGSHEASRFEQFTITDPGPLLQKGENCLAIEGHNRDLRSSDFSLDPFLTTRRIENPDLSKGLCPDNLHRST